VEPHFYQPQYLDFGSILSPNPDKDSPNEFLLDNIDTVLHTENTENLDRLWKNNLQSQPLAHWGNL